MALATGYIHYWIGGTMLILNTAGYLVLAVLVIGSTALYPLALPIVLAALAGYAGVTIVAWMAIGPYFDIAYLAKAIEIALISAISLRLWRSRDELRASMHWIRSLLGGAPSTSARR